MDDTSIIDILGDIISSSSFDGDYDDVLASLAAQGVDLTQYTTSEIEEALKYALQDNSSDIENEHDGNISFGRKMCPSRHGCQGATDCDYCLGDYPG